VRRRTPVLLGTALALVASTPALGAEVVVRGLDVGTTPRAAGGPGWDRDDVTILPGDTVRWAFDGTTLPHNVVSTSANWNVRTTYDAPGTAVAFDTPGRYDFVCDVHATTMYGTVIVGEPPPPPLSQQPFPNDGGVLGALETGGLDRTRPTLRSVRVQRIGRGVRVRFRVSERSLVTVRFKRGDKTVKTKKVNAAGTARATVRNGLRAGRYDVELRAEDLAGNRSGLRTARVTVTPR
jgi:plastocyanin